jgi:hypothetical protein
LRCIQVRSTFGLNLEFHGLICTIWVVTCYLRIDVILLIFMICAGWFNINSGPRHELRHQLHLSSTPIKVGSDQDRRVCTLRLQRLLWIDVYLIVLPIRPTHVATGSAAVDFVTNGADSVFNLVHVTHDVIFLV